MAKLPRKVKKAYDYLDIDYNATEEEIRTRQRVLIKVARAKVNEQDKVTQKKIDKITHATRIILKYIKRSGVPKDDGINLDATGESIHSGYYILVLVTALAIISFIALL